MFTYKVQDEVLEDVIQHGQAAVQLAQEQQCQLRGWRRGQQDDERAEQREHHSGAHEEADRKLQQASGTGEQISFARFDQPYLKCGNVAMSRSLPPCARLKSEDRIL